VEANGLFEFGAHCVGPLLDASPRAFLSDRRKAEIPIALDRETTVFIEKIVCRLKPPNCAQEGFWR
jgi:hypothetical protein